MVKRRKSQVTPPPSGCPLKECVRLLAGAWTADVIWYLREGERCFTELRTDLKGISAKMLTTRLRRLEQDGIVERRPKPTSPPTTWYALTPVGLELCGALTHIVEVAQRLGPAAMGHSGAEDSMGGSATPAVLPLAKPKAGGQAERA